MELVKLKGADFGIEETKAQQISAQFKPMLDKMVELEKEFNKVMKLPKNNPETALKAGELRKQFVKVRTGTAEIHKAQKAFYLAGGRFVDAWKNAQLFASQGLEEKLLEIETYQQRLEAERVENLRLEREEALRPYFQDVHGINLGAMQADVWEAYYEKKKRDFEDMKRAEAEAEAKRAEEERLSRLELSRLERLSPLADFIEGWGSLNFREMPDAQYDEIYETAKAQKEEAERIKELRDRRERILAPFTRFVNLEGVDLGIMALEDFQAVYDKALAEDKAYSEKLRLQEEENKRLQAEAEAKEKARLEAEAKARAEAEQREKERLAQIEEERKKREALEAELKAKRDKEEVEARAKAEAEAKARAEAEKLAKAGDKKRILAWIDLFPESPEVPTGKAMKPESVALVNSIESKYQGFLEWAKKEAEKL